MKKHYIDFMLALLLVSVFGACAKIDSKFAVDSDANTLTTVRVTFADGTGGFSPTVEEPYGDEITVEIPWYYPEGSYNETSLDSLFITGTMPNSSYMSPAFGLNDLSSPIAFTLTAQSGSQRTYTIGAVRKRSSRAEILSFQLNEAGLSAVVVNNRVIIPFTGDDVSGQTATVELSYYATISPDPSTVRDYSSPVVYTVTADDGTESTYTVELGTPVQLESGFGSVRQLWSRSSGDLGFEDYRQISIAVSGNYFLLPNSNEWVAGSSIRYYNRATGAQAGTLNTAGAERIYAIANDANGKVVGINSLYAGNNVCLYVWDNVNAAPRLLARTTDWSSVGGGFYGRKLSVYGDLDADAVIMSTTDGSNAGGVNNILKWTVRNGAIVSQNPEVINYPTAFGYVAKAVPTGTQSTDNYLMCSNLPSYIHYVNGASNTRLNAFSTSYINNPREATPALFYFEFNNAKYTAVMDASAYSSAMHIFDVTDPSAISTSASSNNYSNFHVFDGANDYITSPSANWNVTGDFAVGPVSADGYTMTIYFLVTNGGVVAYELSSIDLNAYN